MALGARTAEFLLVQDDPADELILRDYLDSYRVVNPLYAVRDVPAALAFLDGTAPYHRPGVPDLVLLDLNLPGRGGRIVLHRLRADPMTAQVPVVLLTDSPASELILRAQMLPVQGYARIPVEFATLLEIVKSQADLGIQIRRCP